MEQAIVLETTDDQKRLKYFKTPKEMKQHHDELAKLAQSVVVLALHVGALDKNQILRFYDGDEYYAFGKKDLRAATSNLIREIKDLTTYWKVSRKKLKPKVGPEGLKGTYTPICAGPVLLAFFKEGNNFGPLDPAKWKETGVMGDTLMASLPYAQAGYMLRNTLTMLFFLYVRTMELQEVENAQFSHMDEHMRKVFCESPAAFYVDATGPKMTMDAAVEKGKIKAPISTEDVIRTKRPDFNGDQTPLFKDAPVGKQIYRKAFNNYFFQMLASYNYFSRKYLTENPEYEEILSVLVNKDTTDAMVKEHNIVRETTVRWNSYLAPSRKIQRDKKKKENDLRKKQEATAEKLAEQTQ